MHICFLTSEYPKVGFPHGGVGTFIKNLAIALSTEGHTVSVVGINYENNSEEYIENGIKIYLLMPNNIRGLNWYLNFRSINKKLLMINKENPIDVVEATEMGLSFIQKISTVKYLIRCNGGHHFFSQSENRPISKWKAYQEKRSFKKADKIIGVSKYVLDHTMEYIDFSEKRGEVIFNPTDTQLFYNANPDLQIKGRIFFAGTLCEKKGIRQLIQAMPIIKNVVPEAQLQIAGRDWKFPNGESYKKYLQQFIDPSVKDRIHFIGSIPNSNMPKEIELAQVCVYPSHMEAMPLAWIEVLCMGKAFVASKLGPGPEVVLDNITGLLCDPLSPEDIAEKTIKLLINNDFATRLGVNAREDAINRFDIRNLVVQNIEMYKALSDK